ncbi:MAG TPA: glycosyltransferase family 4 protein [Candidatus Moranbacteria bacterium]|nr:glycosyltransferase family 4 protein [Candidatus Moranbacteria bacterium]
MRVLFFNYEYPPLGGGAGNATFFLLKEFAKISTLEVDLVTSSFDQKKRIEKISDKITVYQIPIGKTGNEFELHHQTKQDLVRYTWAAYWFSRKLLKKNEYDLTHSFFTVPCGALSRWFKFSCKLPYIVSLRGADVPGYSERFDKMYEILLPMIKNIWKNSSQVVSNSTGLKELAAQNFSADKIAIIPNGVDTKEFNPARFNKKPNTVLKIICVSRLTRRKSINTLIEAVAILKKEKRKVKLEVAGEGEDRARLEKLVREHQLEEEVEFVGLIDHDQVADFYTQADIFALTSLNEGMSNTILEAIAMGLPIITTNTGGTAELVEDEKNGFIVAKENPEQVANCIKKLEDNQKLLKAMGAESRIKAEKMSWEKVAQEYFKLYQKVLE